MSFFFARGGRGVSPDAACPAPKPLRPPLRWARVGSAILALILLPAAAWAQAPEPRLSLAEALEQAWARQPEARALAARREAAHAQRQAADAFGPGAARLELAQRLDARGPERGLRELELGLALPLWRTGEQSAGRALADARRQALESETTAARLALAGQLRARWWPLLLAESDRELAEAQHQLTLRLVEDVDRRVRAGDLARADAHQARIAEATARGALARAEGAVRIARQQLAALMGQPLGARPNQDAEPPPDEAALPAAAHLALQALQDQLHAAERQLALQAQQERASPELRIGALQERGRSGERSSTALQLGLSLPLGEGARQTARLAAARAEADALRAQLALGQARLAAEQAEAAARVQALAEEQEAAARRARLAEETAGFLRRAFELGETDLPSRLRIEAEAATARREAVRLRLEHAAALSGWRQAIGLLP